ncbi:hypothetical protein H9P43_003114 [Blastocladiella emersonii ATCC 22665]|nr:hypothetical protein H9P43_003114 [Blastocladiella emersonii ATCC 22665]
MMQTLYWNPRKRQRHQYDDGSGGFGVPADQAGEAAASDAGLVNPVLRKIVRDARPRRVTEQEAQARTLEKLFRGARREAAATPTAAAGGVDEAMAVDPPAPPPPAPCAHCNQPVAGPAGTKCGVCDKAFCDGCLDACESCERPCCVQCNINEYTYYGQQLVCWDCHSAQ